MGCVCFILAWDTKDVGGLLAQQRVGCSVSGSRPGFHSLTCLCSLVHALLQPPSSQVVPLEGVIENSRKEN